MPQKREKQEGEKNGVSKTALLLGAAGLFLFIVGVKRKHRLDEEREAGEVERASRKPMRAGDEKRAAGRAREQLSPRR
ncbi:MAG TPA: hypothetical protein VFX98_08750 [Longimicrobiaceae bacterium]|nr:hypothetical protein [Longimicrobiaceae bacterium]